MALDGKPPKDIPSVSPTGAYLDQFFYWANSPAPVASRRISQGLPGSAWFMANRCNFPKKFMKTRVGV